MKRDKNLTAADAEKSVKLRPLLAVVAWEMFKDRPLAGHGYGRYTQKKDRFHTNRSYNLPLEQARDYVQHNVFLSILVDTGLIGLALMVSWLITIVCIGWMIARNVHAGHETRSVGLLLLGTMTAYVCNGMFHDLMIIPMAHMFLFFIAGIMISVYQYGIAAGELSLSQRALVSGRGLPTSPAQSHPAL
jgi:O-antigen ligase